VGTGRLPSLRRSGFVWLHGMLRGDLCLHLNTTVHEVTGSGTLPPPPPPPKYSSARLHTHTLVHERRMYAGSVKYEYLSSISHELTCENARQPHLN